jgi:cell division protein FtsB
VTPVRWAALGVFLVALLFAIQGGEYSTGDWITLRRDAAREAAEVEALKQDIDSLNALARLIERDPAEQERVARERFGMIRPGEFLYRLVPADSNEVNGDR